MQTCLIEHCVIKDIFKQLGSNIVVMSFEHNLTAVAA